MIIGFTSGVFDMFHIGHLNILRRAKEKCDYLIVGVSTDEVVQSYKHKTPIIPYEQRAAIVKAIKFVDEVVPQTTMDKIEMWKLKHFDVMFHGDEWKGTDLYNRYEQEFAKVGAHIEYLSHTEGISSSMLRETLNRMDVNNCKMGGGKIGYTSGTYDMFHIGHLNIIRNAKAKCDVLIVAVSTDDLVESYKGHKPVVPFEERCDIVGSIRGVDIVIPQTHRDKIKTFDELRYDIMFVGSDWKGDSLFLDTEQYLRCRGAELVYLPHTDGISSTMLRTITSHRSTNERIQRDLL